jgi:hypothetical protein
MRMSRLVMVVAAACFASASLAEAQGRGHGPTGHGPQIARAGSGGPNVSAGRTGGGNSGNAGATPGDSGRGHGNPGTTPGGAEDRGGNAASGGRGKAGKGRGNGGGPPGDAGEGHGRGASDKENGASFVAKMNPQLRARLESMLPSGVMLEQAAAGFRNQGQFIAALQQSQNHDLSFGDLKTAMTGDNALSLGQAMRKLGVETKED